jgi:DNA-binding PadR family transcriptional regulator
MSRQGIKSSDRLFGAMEYFLLALIGHAGLRSLYLLQQRAGLQPGGIRPALHRLEESGFLTRGESSTRRRRDLSLTARGMAFLDDTWKQCLSDYPDTESALRAACVAMLMGDPKYAGQYLEGLALGRQISAEEKSMNAELLEKTLKDPLSTYVWMRTLCEARRRNAESEAFSLLGHSLKENHQPDVQPR